MKTTHLFEEVTSISNLLAAFKLAAKCKRGKKKEVFDYELNLGFNLYKLQEALVSGGYRVLGYKKFNIYEPKKRIIYAPYFEDLIVQFAIYNIVNPFFEKHSYTMLFLVERIKVLSCVEIMLELV